MAALEADGLGHSQAVFIAATTGTVTQSGPNAFDISEKFLTGNNANFKVTLAPHRAAPEPGEEIHATYSTDDAGFRFRISYVVPYEGMPDDVRKAIDDGRLGSSGVALAGFHDSAPGNWGVEALVDGLMTKIDEEGIEQGLKAVEEWKKLPEKELTDLFKIYKAGKDVIAAYSAMDEYRREMEQLDGLEACARNPANPLTANTFKNDPGQQQKVLDEIADARSEVSSNTAVIFVGQGIKQLPNLVGWAVDVEGGSGAGKLAGKILGFVFTPIVKASNSLLTTLSKARIADAAGILIGCQDFGGQCVEPSPTPTGGVSNGDSTSPPVSTPQSTVVQPNLCTGGDLSGDITEDSLSPLHHETIRLHVVGQWACDERCDWDLSAGSFTYDYSYHDDGTCELNDIASSTAHAEGSLQGTTGADAMIQLGDQHNGTYLLGGSIPITYDSTGCDGFRQQRSSTVSTQRCPISAGEALGKVVVSGGRTTIDFSCTAHEGMNGGTQITITGILTTTLPYPPPTPPPTE